MDVEQDTPQFYANHAEINFTPHDFCLTFGRMSSRIKREDVQAVIQSGVLPVRADVQIVFPTTLLIGLLHALSSQKDLYEKQFGIILTEVPGAKQNG